MFRPRPVSRQIAGRPLFALLRLAPGSGPIDSREGTFSLLLLTSWLAVFPGFGVLALHSGASERANGLSEVQVIQLWFECHADHTEVQDLNGR